MRNLSGAPYNFDHPEALVFTPVSQITRVGDLWIANEDTGAGSVTEISTTPAFDGAFIRNLSDPIYGFSDPVALAYDGSHIWVANLRSASVTEMNFDGSWVRTPTGSTFGLAEPRGLASANGRLWVANETGNSVSELPPVSPG